MTEHLRMRWKALLAGVGLALALALGAEVALRAVSPELLWDQEDVVPRHLGRFDSELGWALEPGARGVSRRTGRPVEYRINARGLRDDETDYAKPEGVYRVVLLGDSYAFGFGIPIEEHLSVLLEREGLEVVNLGVSGFGLDQELLHLRAEGLRYDPDLVLLFVPHYADERHMHAQRFGKAKPHFVLRDGELTLAGTPVLELPTRAAGGLRGVHRALRRHSAAYEALRNLAAGGGRDEPNGAGARTPRPDPAASGERRRGVNALGGALVTEMHRAANAHGAEFLLMTPLGDLRESASKAGVSCLSIEGVLGDPRYELGDGLGHLDGAGNRALVELLKGRLGSR